MVSMRVLYAILPTVLSALVVEGSPVPQAQQQQQQAGGAGFVKAAGTRLEVDSCPFFFHGTNIYYLQHKSIAMATRALDSAKELGLNVVRTWGFIDGAAIDGIVFQTFENGVAKINEGANGLGRLDQTIKMAKDRGMRLVIPLVNNWKNYGGMDAYVKGLAGNTQQQQFHDQFYTDPKIKDAYKNYVRTVVTRMNPLTGLRYSEDPTIMAWEVANEPRCAAENLPASPNCNPAMITAWIDEMSKFIKEVDGNRHLVAVGDEGFFNRQGDLPWPYKAASNGGDFDAFVKLPAIDFGTFHMYPEHWGVGTKEIPNVSIEQFGTDWIKAHAEVAKSVQKPVLMEEYASQDKTNRGAIYSSWHKTAREGGVAATMFWSLADKEDNGSLFPDFDKNTIYRTDNNIDQTVREQVQAMQALNTCAK
ncbi:hypothetical protein HK102_002180 [Quaeritorhiza haematococci]|nr:hypothetical protein HK102_002180 [Quaeritorhiza haematococci]